MVTLFKKIIKRAVLKPLKKIIEAVQPMRQRIDVNADYEPLIVDALKKYIKDGFVCVDVGACLGDITLRLASLVGESGFVYSFEANPDNAANLKKNVKENGLKKRVKVVNMAVNDGGVETVSLFYGRNNSPYEWNIVGHDVEGNSTEAKFKVKATSLDRYFSSRQKINLIKIDAENAEAQILAGMEEILRRDKPILIIEFHDEKGWNSRRLLYQAGYSLFTMDDKRIDRENDLIRVYHCLAKYD